MAHLLDGLSPELLADIESVAAGLSTAEAGLLVAAMLAGSDTNRLPLAAAPAWQQSPVMRRLLHVVPSNPARLSLSDVGILVAAFVAEAVKDGAADKGLRRPSAPTAPTLGEEDT